MNLYTLSRFNQENRSFGLSRQHSVHYLITTVARSSKSRSKGRGYMVAIYNLRSYPNIVPAAAATTAGRPNADVVAAAKVLPC